MKFEKSTKDLFKKIIKDLKMEASKYDWKSKEYEKIIQVMAEIEYEICDYI